MAATLIGENSEREGWIDDGFKRSYSRSFYVKTDNVKDGPQTARTCAGIPAMWDTYAPPGGGDNDKVILVNRVSARKHADDPNLWEVTVEYSSDAKNKIFQADSPLDRKARTRFRFERFRNILEFDVKGKAIANSAGDAFSPPPEEDATLLVIEVQQNLDHYDPTQMQQYIDRVNNDVFLGFQPGQVKVQDIDCPDQDYENGVTFFPTKFVFYVRPLDYYPGYPHPWHVSLLDQGYRQWIQDLGDYVNLIDGYGHNVSQPGLLDGNGVELDHGADPVYMRYQTLEEIPFSTLPLNFP